jgi:dTDP-4-dehydrorhamnose reductase
MIETERLARPGRLELWGGLECTVARVGDRFRDQLADTGHDGRDDDLARVAALGIRTLRYPVLWEHVSPENPDECRWERHDGRMRQLADLGIRPIAGLLHHGSGPRYTNLLDPAMPGLLAAHARRVAERYPHLDLWTPVNEPLTTARFSGLYGHWYPHGRGMDVFFRILVNECLAVVAAMRAVREVRPDARLVQTEDMGKVFATLPLSYQADYENERRWLTFDLLCGRLDRHHPMWPELVSNGVPEADLDALLEAPCPPGIVGINHYLTSDRFLDDDRERYPAFSWGGNAFHTYADVEAVRVDLPGGDTGPAARLREAWERYGLPVAVTEAHLGCTREEQLRWLAEVWAAASAVRGEGADIRAVTVWSLFGAVDWNSLLTRAEGFYEPGAFDVRTRGGPPRPTALAKAAASLARDGRFDHPAVDGLPWWRQPGRFYHPPPAATLPAPALVQARTVLIAGDGRLGQAMAQACEARGLAFTIAGRDRLDPAIPNSVHAAIGETKPWAVLHCAGYPGTLVADEDPRRVWRDNVAGAETLARAAASAGIAFAATSTDQVFDGTRGVPYTESDPVCPLGLFGRTKAEAEQAMLAAHPGAVIARAGPLFGAGPADHAHRSVQEMARAAGLKEGETMVLSPAYIPDLVHALLDLVIDGSGGIWHLANEGAIDVPGFLSRISAGPGSDEDAGAAEPALTLVLASERGVLMPHLGTVWDRLAAAAA